jgi:hypothetical protein
MVGEDMIADAKSAPRVARQESCTLLYWNPPTVSKTDSIRMVNIVA